MFEIAMRNLEALWNNPYPGRGIVIGRTEDGKHLIQIYWIMGRSENSRNRVFKFDTRIGRVWTEAADRSKVKDSSLIFYTAMVSAYGCHVVSNGDQTDTIIDAISADANPNAFFDALSVRSYEPDDPNWTPRISAICNPLSQYAGQICIIRKSRFGRHSERHLFSYEMLPEGFGYCVATYTGDGDPLPAFTGEPFLLPLNGDIVDIRDRMWAALNADNRVALALKFVNSEPRSTGITVINRFDQVT